MILSYFLKTFTNKLIVGFMLMKWVLILQLYIYCIQCILHFKTIFLTLMETFDELYSSEQIYHY